MNLFQFLSVELNGTEGSQKQEQGAENKRHRKEEQRGHFQADAAVQENHG